MSDIIGSNVKLDGAGSKTTVSTEEQPNKPSYAIDEK
jgi:hypothetical protein